MNEDDEWSSRWNLWADVEVLAFIVVMIFIIGCFCAGGSCRISITQTDNPETSNQR